jgi:hypothetical protein
LGDNRLTFEEYLCLELAAGRAPIQVYARPSIKMGKREIVVENDGIIAAGATLTQAVNLFMSRVNMAIVSASNE